MKRCKLTYTPGRNFHNQRGIKIIVDVHDTHVFNDTEMYVVSARVAKRINSHFCGISDCLCGSSGTVQLNANATEFGIPVKNTYG